MTGTISRASTLPGIVQDVADLAEAAGFRLLDMGPHGIEVHGPLDSIAILVDTFFQREAQAPRRYRATRINRNTTEGAP